MKKLFLMMMALTAMLTATAADDYPYLTFQTQDGTEQSVAVDDLVLTVSGTQLVATNAEGTQTFTLTDLSRMYFSTSASDVVTGISTLVTTDGTVEAYTVGGTLMGRYNSLAEARQSLQPGIYVMKTDNRTFKTTIR